MKRLELKEIIREEIQKLTETVTDKYLKEIEKYKPLAIKKLKKMGFKVKDLGNKLEVRGGDVTDLHMNYISTTETAGKKGYIIGGGEFETISKI